MFCSVAVIALLCIPAVGVGAFESQACIVPIAFNSIGQAPDIHHDDTEMVTPDVILSAPADTAAPTALESAVRPLNVGLALLAVACIVLVIVKRWYRLPSRRRSPDLTDALTPLFAMVGLYIGMIVGGSLAMQFLVHPEVAGPNTVVTAPPGAEQVAENAAGSTNPAPMSLRSQAIVRTGGFLLALPILVMYARTLRDRRSRMGFRQPGTDKSARPRRWHHAALVGGGALLLVYPIVNTGSIVAAITAETLSGVTPDSVSHKTLTLFIEDASVWRWVTAALVVIGAPIFEEFAYRGMLQTALRAAIPSAWAAIAIASIPFALMHVGAVETYALVPLFLLSFGLGWIYERTQSIVAPIVMHGIFNLLNLMLAMLIVGP